MKENRAKILYILYDISIKQNVNTVKVLIQLISLMSAHVSNNNATPQPTTPLQQHH